MATTIPPAEVVISVEPPFIKAERIALACFLTGYSGLTRGAYALAIRHVLLLVPVTSTAPVPGTTRRHRILRPRPGESRPGLRDDRPQAVHDLGVLPLRRRGRTLETSPAWASDDPAWTPNPTPSAWTATRSARSWSPPASALPSGRPDRGGNRDDMAWGWSPAGRQPPAPRPGPLTGQRATG